MIGEQRQQAADFLGPVDYALPLPDPQDLAALPDPRLDPEAMDQVASWRSPGRAGCPRRSWAACCAGTSSPTR